MKLVDLSKSKQEAKAEQKASKSPIASHDYHYGTKLHLEKGHIDKLGIGHLNVGDEVSVMAKAKVTGRTMAEHDGGDQHHSMELQLTHMGVGKSEEVGTEEPSMKEYAAKRGNAR